MISLEVKCPICGPYEPEADCPICRLPDGLEKALMASAVVGQGVMRISFDPDPNPGEIKDESADT